jgi:formamidopyrimidine-DNA glycosylase
VPELPEVEALARFMAEQLAGKAVLGVELGAISALKTVVPPIDSLVGRRFAGVGRRGKMLAFEMEGDPPLWLVCHLARGGWIQWRETISEKRIRPGRGPMALRVRVEVGRGFDLTEAGTEKRLAVWVVSDPEEVERVASLGPDPLSPGFDRDALGRALQGGGTLKSALSDQGRIAGIGNAYSDEILHAARMSPFKPVGRLGDGELDHLYEALLLGAHRRCGAVERPASGRPQGREALGHVGAREDGPALSGVRRRGA